MNFKTLLDDTDAVSPVIGVILMVAITVILAAVIGTFVLGLGDQVQTTAPNVQFDATQPDTSVDAADDSGNFTVAEFEITGGQTVDASTLEVSNTINGTNIAHLSQDEDNNLDHYYVEGLSGELSAGDTISLIVRTDYDSADTETMPLDGEEVSVVWASEGQSQSLSTHELENVEVENGDVTA